MNDHRDESASSPPPALRALRELVDKWREEAGDDNDDPYDPAASYLAGMERCADELDALLSRLEKEKDFALPGTTRSHK